MSWEFLKFELRVRTCAGSSPLPTLQSEQAAGSGRLETEGEPVLSATDHSPLLHRWWEHAFVPRLPWVGQVLLLTWAGLGWAGLAQAPCSLWVG